MGEGRIFVSKWCGSRSGLRLLCLGRISTELLQYKESLSVIMHVLVSETSVTEQHDIKIVIQLVFFFLYNENLMNLLLMVFCGVCVLYSVL